MLNLVGISLQALVGRSTVVCVSDGCLLPLMLAQSRDKFPSLQKLFTVESSPHCCRMIREVRITEEVSF